MEDLRYYVKLAKIKEGWSYKNIADYLSVSTSSIYNWLNHQFELSKEKQYELYDLLVELLR